MSNHDFVSDTVDNTDFKLANCTFLLNLLSFYKNEKIHSASSHKKGHFMKVSNYLAFFIYTCLLTNVMLLGFEPGG